MDFLLWHAFKEFEKGVKTNDLYSKIEIEFV